MGGEHLLEQKLLLDLVGTGQTGEERLGFAGSELGHGADLRMSSATASGCVELHAVAGGKA